MRRSGVEWRVVSALRLLGVELSARTQRNESAAGTAAVRLRRPHGPQRTVGLHSCCASHMESAAGGRAIGPVDAASGDADSSSREWTARVAQRQWQCRPPPPPSLPLPPLLPTTPASRAEWTDALDCPLGSPPLSASDGASQTEVRCDATASAALHCHRPTSPTLRSIRSTEDTTRAIGTNAASESSHVPECKESAKRKRPETCISILRTNQERYEHNTCTDRRDIVMVA